MKIKLNAEEKEIIAGFEKGTLKLTRNSAMLVSRLKAAARNTIIKDKSVSIRISAKDLTGLQVRAIEDGIPYQALMASVLHKYVSGKLKERAE